MEDQRDKIANDGADSIPAPPPTTPETRRRTEIRSAGTPAVNAWLVAILLIALAAYFLKTTGTFPSSLFDPTAEPRPIAARGDLADDEKSTIELFKNCSPAVVHITTSLLRRSNLNIFELPRGSGSGFVWDEDGHIVTNYHVVREAVSNASVIRVILADNSVWEARVVGHEANKDLAVLKIEAPAAKLTPLPVGESENLEVGQKVFAIGNPFSLDQTLTTGVISGLGREIESVTQHPIQNVIQTDAAINPGNSGGPLIDSAGRLIGVNTAIYSPTKSYAGIGFAVPVDTVNEIVPQLIQDGEVTRPGLGATILPDSIVATFRKRSILSSSGVMIRDVIDGGASDKAGLRGTSQSPDGKLIPGDLIVGVDDHPIQSTKDLYRALDQYDVGDEVKIAILRDDEKHEFQLKLQPIPSIER